MIRRAWHPGPVALAVSLLAAASPARAGDPLPEELRAVGRAVAAEDWAGARSHLDRAAAAHPDDCEVRAWQAWFETTSGRLLAAEALLCRAGCPARPEDRGRWALLRALVADKRGDVATVRRALDELGERQALWPEDGALAQTLAERHLEGYAPPLEARAELALGATSNAFAAAPADAALREAPGSGLLRPDLRVRLRAPRATVTASLDLGARGHLLSAGPAGELSRVEAWAAAEARLDRSRVRPTLRYRHEELRVDGTGTRFSALDGTEAEVSPSPRLTLFGGVARRRFFTDEGRTRTEWDLALLRATTLARRPVVLGAAFRLFRARDDVHDQVGGTLTASGDLPLRASARARLGLTVSVDDFPGSGGLPGLVAFGTAERRRDLALRLSAGLWRPLASRAALGLTYELARRWSTADDPGHRYYPYSDHRLLAAVRLGARGNPWRAGGRGSKDRAPIPHADVASWSVLWDDQGRRLLRRDEDLSDDCGCTAP